MKFFLKNSYIQQAKIFNENTNPLVLGLLITMGSMLAYFLIVGHPVWGTNDDVAMSMIAAGVWLSAQPSAELLFIHPFYGWFISHLYIWKPEIPWYGISFILIVSLSLVILNYSILRLRRQLYFSLTMIFVTIATVLPALWLLQFTVVAGLVTVAGVILLLSFFMHEPTTKKSFIIGILTSLCLLIIGAMIRFDSTLMVGVLSAPCATALFWKFALSTKNGKDRKLYLLRLVTIGIIFGVLLTGLQVHKQKHYGNSTEWAKWFSLNKTRAEFSDFHTIKYNEQTRNVFDSVGWNQTDYDMIMSWQYVDPIRHSPESFLYVANHLQKGLVEKTIQIGDFERWKASLMRIIDDILSLSGVETSIAASLLLCIFAAGLFTTPWKKWNSLYLSLIVCAIIVVYFYLYFVLDRSPFYVLRLLWICVLWMMLLVSTSSIKYAIPQAGRWKGYNAVSRVILVLLLFVSVFISYDKARDKVKRRVEKQNILERRIAVWNTNLPQNSIVYNIGNSYLFKFHLPLKPFAYLRSIEGFLATGCTNQSPHQRQIINSLGLSDDFYASLAQKENVYMVKNEGDVDIKQLSTLRNFYVEEYGLKLSFVDDPNLPYLYRMVFR